MRINRWLHRNRTQQLQRMVLHHIAQRTNAVVISAALFDAKVFRHRDLNIRNMLAPPHRFKQCIGKA